MRCIRTALLSSLYKLSTANIQINSHTACTPARFFSIFRRFCARRAFRSRAHTPARLIIHGSLPACRRSRRHAVGIRHQPATRPPARFFSKKSFKGRFAGACAHSERGDPARGYPAHVGIQPTCHCGSAAADGFCTPPSVRESRNVTPFSLQWSFIAFLGFE